MGDDGGEEDGGKKEEGLKEEEGGRENGDRAEGRGETEEDGKIGGRGGIRRTLE